MSVVVRYARVARVHALGMSVGPILCCYLYCRSRYDSLNIMAYIFVSIAILLFHLSVNTVSEYRDCLKGVDDGNVDGPRYRLVTGIVEAKYVLRLGISAFLTAIASGIMATITSSLILLVPGFVGAGLALFYSEWPIGYKYKALGEIGVFIAYGPLLVFSCIFSLANQVCWQDMLISIPIGLLTMCVLLANNIRDFDFDLGKTKTLPSVMGLKIAYTILFSSVHLSFAIVPILIYLGLITKMGFIIFLAYPIIFTTIKTINSSKFVDVFGIIQAVFCGLLAIGLLNK